jgi:Na+-transporting NADH:ubiquinone oxidoreductase subunit D
MAIATVREYLGSRTLFHYPVPTVFSEGDWVIMIMPPGAFFVLALAVWAARSYDLKRQAAKEEGA